jgi:hypothetical protein
MFVIIVISLQIVVAVFVQTGLADWTIYPDPLDCHSYYNGSSSDGNFTHETCSVGLVFDIHDSKCEVGFCELVELKGLKDKLCSNNLGFYCNSDTSFKYCADGIKIALNKPCPKHSKCNWENKNPCMWSVLLEISTIGELTM